MAFVQPFDLQQIFVNIFAGGWEIFMFVAFITIAALAASFRMPNAITAICFALFGIMFATYFPAIYFVTVLLSGIAVFYGVGALIKR